MDPEMYPQSYICFFHFLVISNDIFIFGYIQWTLKAVPDILYIIATFFSIFFSHFLAIFSAMKYPGAKNEISIESSRHLYEKRNEISQI